MVYQIYSEGQH